MTRIEEALARLWAAADDGRLASLCASHDLVLMTLFGRGLRDPAAARDVDIAVLRRGFGTCDELPQLVCDLMGLLELDEIDVADLGRRDEVLSFHALAWGTPLWQAEPGVFAEQQMRAMSMYGDGAHVRRAELARLLA